MKKYTVIHYDELPSTNTLVKKNHQSLEDHTLVITDYQTMGRGRRDNAWFSEKGKNFLGTFYKVTDDQASFRFLLEASVALLKTLESFGIEASIKPPNDIYANDKKMAGILIEVIHLDALHVISGIGLNIKSYFNKSSISMEAFLGRTIPVSDVVVALKEAYEEVETKEIHALFKRYKSHIDFDAVQVVEASGNTPLQSINETFECKVEGMWKACESLQFAYVPNKRMFVQKQ